MWYYVIEKKACDGWTWLGQRLFQVTRIYEYIMVFVICLYWTRVYTVPFVCVDLAERVSARSFWSEMEMATSSNKDQSNGVTTA